MIHIEDPILTTLLIMRMKAVEPPGGRHGTHNGLTESQWDELDCRSSARIRQKGL